MDSVMLSGTVLEQRDGGPLLWAVEHMDGDRLVQAVVMEAPVVAPEPEEEPWQSA